MDKITCPVCSRLNDPKDSRCWFCSAELHTAGTAPNNEKNWLSGLQEDLNPGEGNLTSDLPKDFADSTPEDQIPDWLARIRAREAAEREEKRGTGKEIHDQKKSQGAVPDWLIDDNGASELTAPVGDSRADEVPENETGKDLPMPDIETTPIGDAEPDWIASLKSWDTNSIQESIPEGRDPVTSQKDNNTEGTSEVEPVFVSPDKINDLPITEDQFGTSEITTEPSMEKQIDSNFDSKVESHSPGKLVQDNSNLENDINPDSQDKENYGVESGWRAEGSIPNEFWQPLESPPLGPRAKEASGEIENDQIDNSSESASFAKTDPISPEVVFNSTNTSKPFIPDDLPEWLSEKKPKDPLPPTPNSKITQSVLDNDLPNPEKAKLPAWLESQKPIEAVEIAKVSAISSSTEITDVELSTLQGSLTGVRNPRFVGKPSDLGGGLKLTDRQKTNVAILASLIGSSETLLDEKLDVTREKSNSWARIILLVVFISLVLLGGTIFKDYRLLPALFPEDVVQTFDQVNRLPAEKPVLIAGDYEAALAGEIRLASQPLIEHLMRRNLAIAIISTNPVDTALLSSQILTGMKSVPTYSISDRVVDLGYLPGGSIAVQSLIGGFKTAVPLTAELTSTDANPLLTSVASLKDFGAVIVITDDSESARIWIEQIHPQIATTPLLMVTSAQAAPLVQPYFQSRQLSGLVSGMPGGLIYERILQTDGEAFEKLTSFQILSILIVVMILVGGFISLVKPASFEGTR